MYVTEEERRGQLVTRLREQHLWTRERLAKEAGVSVTTITGMEDGRTRVRLGTVEKIAKALGVDPLDLLHPVEDITQSETLPKVMAR